MAFYKKLSKPWIFYIHRALAVYLILPILILQTLPFRTEANVLTGCLVRALENTLEVSVRTRVVFDQEVPASFQAEATEVIARVNHLFGRMSVDNVGVKVLHSDGALRSSYSISENKLVLGIREWTQTGKFPTFVLVHEYFHASFLRHLELTIEGLNGSLWSLMQPLRTRAKKNFQDFWSRYQAARAQLRSDYPEFYRGNEEIRNTDASVSPRRRSHDARLDELNSELFKNQRQFNDLADFEIGTRPYSELYADLAASLYHGNGRITEELDRIIPTQQAENRFRDFSRSRNFREFSGHLGGYVDEYTFLSPTRGAIWAMLQSKLAKDATPELILRVFLAATRNHLENGRYQAWSSRDNLDMLNQEFFRIFVEQGKLHGLWR